MKGTYLGPRFENAEIRSYLEQIKAPFHALEDPLLFERLAELLDQGKVIGWFNGAMEFGPRSLGGRSIIGDPRNQQMQSVMNLKIKYRESFRPFAPAIAADAVTHWFNTDYDSPYMLKVATVKDEHRIAMSDEAKALFGIEKLNVARSTVPAITHVDYSARLQTVHPETNPRFHALITAFEAFTDCPILINTSFNVRGEPIVCSILDAFNCFMGTNLDILVVENFILFKSDQDKSLLKNYKDKFELD